MGIVPAPMHDPRLSLEENWAILRAWRRRQQRYAMFAGFAIGISTFMLVGITIVRAFFW